MGDVKLNDPLDQWCTPGLTAAAHRELLGCGSLEELRLKAALLGVSLPDEQYIQINALSYLGGSKTYVREPAAITHEYEAASTNSYFGVVHTREWRRSVITVCPTNSVHEKED